MATLGMKREHDLAKEWLELGRDLDPVLVLFTVLQLLDETARAEGLRSEAKVVSRAIYEWEGAPDLPFQPRAYAIIAGQTLLGAQGELGWRDVCATLAQKEGIAPFFYGATYAVEQFAVGQFEQKKYLPEDAPAQIDQFKALLRARMEAARIDAATLASLSPPTRPRL